MKRLRNIIMLLAGVAGIHPPVPAAPPAEAPSAHELAGLWQARRRFGPDIRGPLVIFQHAGRWQAEIAGRQAPATVAGDTVTLQLPQDQGAFRGKLTSQRGHIVGHWIQPATAANGTRYATPVTLVGNGRDLWRGDVQPLAEELTCYLVLKPREDGSVGAFLRNPERNFGIFLGLDRLERQGSSVKLLGKKRSAAQGASVVAAGVYHDDVLSIWMPDQGGTFDFQRVKAGQANDFYPRGHPTVPYHYTPPPPGPEGWPTASLEDVGIARDGIERFVQRIIDTPIDSIHAPETHGVLIARHGKLVLEEYFHGEHRDKLHDTRSAAKSLTATLVGAAIRAGAPLDTSTPVYRVMNGGTFPADLEPRKRP